MRILSFLFGGIKKVLTERICPACLESFPGEGYDYAGRVFCSIRCVPAVLRDVKGDLAARARAAGIGS